MLKVLLGAMLWVSLLSELHPRVNGEGVVAFLVTLLVTAIVMPIIV